MQGHSKYLGEGGVFPLGLPLALPFFSTVKVMLSVTKPTENKKEMKYRVAAEYEPAHEDEIALVVGDIVYVLHAYDDGKLLSPGALTPSN